MIYINRYFPIFFLLFSSCNNHPKKTDPCNLMNVMGIGEYILFDGFEEINNISFKPLKTSDEYITYSKDKIKKHEESTFELKINNKTSQIIENNCLIVINDSLTYKITDVLLKRIERYGMWGSVGFSCYLIHYRVNDSLINDQQTLFIKYHQIDKN